MRPSAGPLSRAALYGLAGLGCLVFIGLRVRSRAEDPRPPVPVSRPSAPWADPKAVSAPPPAVTPPVSRDTARALQPILAAHPVMQAREKALEAQAAQGDAVVPGLLAGCLASPHDDARVVDAVVVLRRIGTPGAREALAEIRRRCPAAARAEGVLDRAERR